jgi:hypothetical protein
MVGTDAKMAAFCKYHSVQTSQVFLELIEIDMAGTAYSIQPVVFTWANKVLSRDGDDAARAVTLFSMNGESPYIRLILWGDVLKAAQAPPLSCMLFGASHSIRQQTLYQ